ncbi:MAG: NAD(P)/FAD-dependent oxidoreductase [Deltaproteobacteria bacterium]|nr:MAG: NAD(P)/FAD-dependent oxidoreductase [Deltaproteobacteria bacterium]
MTDLDAVVVGGGVVGLACARALALSGREVALLEAEKDFGTHTSSRNSEVIHAGLYYPPGSLKARSCERGRRALYAYLAEKGLPHRRIGKLIVATTEAEIGNLEGYKKTAHANGAGDLEWLDAAEAHRMEPEVRCVRALFSPSTGILDVHALMRALARDAQQAGASLARNAPVLGGRVADTGIELRVGGDSRGTLRARTIVNAAGLHAQDVAHSIEGVPPASIPDTHYAKGHYFVLKGSSPFSHLVYPVASGGGLGVHVTLDMAGRVRFGPDVTWVQEIEYSFDESRAPSFYAAIRRYYGGLQDGALEPGYTGIRPKIVGPGKPPADFVIQGPEAHGLPGLVNLYGIESPGLTASLALAEDVVALACS